MKEIKIFLSVGAPSNEAQEQFLKAIEQKLRNENLNTYCVGRDTFTSGSPLIAITDLMNKCSGAVILAMERTYFSTGLYKRGGPQQTILADAKYTTPWNQIEAGMSHAKGIPLLVIVENGLTKEGLLESKHGWFIMSTDLNPASLSSREFNGVLSDWKDKVREYANTTQSKSLNPAEMTLKELFGSLKPSQFVSLIGVIVVILITVFTLGAKFPAILDIFKSK